MYFWLRRKAIRLLRRAIAVILILALVIGISGIPVVTRGPKDRGQPFPCQDRPCGCASAEQCWKHCCCFTNKEKLAWASEHGVTPPTFVVEAAAREARATLHACRDGECCHQVAEAHTRGHSCCQKSDDHEHSATAAPALGKKSKRKMTLVLSDMARKCGGMPSIVLLIADALPNAVLVTWNPVDAVTGYVVEASPSYLSVDLSPPVPPPKLSGARVA